MKKLFVGLAVATVAAACLCLCACGGGKKDSSTVANPMEETTLEGQEEAVGISLAAPEGAQNVKYFVYNTEEPMAETQFEYQGVACCLRAQATDLTEFPMTAQEYIDSLASDKESANEADISGMNYKWTLGADVTVQDRPAQWFFAEDDGGVGIILWLDPVPGFVYSLSMSGGAAQDLLLQIADACFVPLQGDVG